MEDAPNSYLGILPHPVADRGGQRKPVTSAPGMAMPGSPDCRTKPIRGKAIRSCPCKEKKASELYSLVRFYRSKIPRYPQSAHRSLTPRGTIPRLPYLGQYSSVILPRMIICVSRHFLGPLYLGSTVPRSRLGPPFPHGDPTRG